MASANEEDNRSVVFEEYVSNKDGMHCNGFVIPYDAVSFAFLPSNGQ